MQKLGIWALGIVGAFVIGMIVSATPVFAPGIGEGDSLVADAIIPPGFRLNP